MLTKDIQRQAAIQAKINEAVYALMEAKKLHDLTSKDAGEEVAAWVDAWGGDESDGAFKALEHMEDELAKMERQQQYLESTIGQLDDFDTI